MKKYGSVFVVVLVLLVLGACVAPSSSSVPQPAGSAESLPTAAPQEEATGVTSIVQGPATEQPAQEEPPTEPPTQQPTQQPVPVTPYPESIIPDEHVRAPEGFGDFPIAVAAYCSSLIDINLEHTYKVLTSLDFWIFYANFAPLPTVMQQMYPDATFAGCFHLFWRDERPNFETYIPFDVYLLTPCISEGNIPVTYDIPLPSSGLSSANPPMRTVLANRIDLGDGAYISCLFDLKALETQYANMTSNGAATLIYNGTGGLTASDIAEQLSELVENMPDILPYHHFAMAAATAALTTTAMEEAQFEFPAGFVDSFERPTVSHPVIFFRPNCSYNYWGEYELPASQVITNHAPRVGGLQDDTGGATCTYPIQLDYLTFPDGTGANATLGAFVNGLEFTTDWVNRWPNACELHSDCFFPAPASGVNEQYVYWQYADLFKEPDADPCLVPTGDDDWPSIDSNTNQEYRRYFNLRFKDIGVVDWNTWCSTSIAPSVLDHLQNHLPFWSGESEVIIGMNPDTGEYFDGSLYEIWIDPNSATGT